MHTMRKHPWLHLLPGPRPNRMCLLRRARQRHRRSRKVPDFHVAVLWDGHFYFLPDVLKTGTTPQSSGVHFLHNSPAAKCGSDRRSIADCRRKFMFRESLLDSSPMRRNGKRWPMATAFVLESIAAALVIMIPLL